ncbi:MAG: TIM barrel protein [Oscillospiraceae bacterium]|jgi:hydroxypyruvate isomerase|nr:TIM barrel protein [Oscillospiraceae bacterium]
MFTLSANGGWFAGDYYQKYREAKKNGFQAVEMLGWRDIDLDRARAVIDETGMQQSCLLFSSRDPAINEILYMKRGIVWTDVHDPFLRAMEETLEAAHKLKCPNICVTTGNERSDVSRYVQHTNIVTALRRAAELIKGSGVRIVLEPLNVLVNHKGYYLVTTAEAADIIDEVASPDVTILYDVYHQQISEGNVIDTIRANIGRIGHIHVGDVPGRNQPGTGELNYRNIFKAIDETGYTGYVTFECGCTVSPEQVSRDMLELLNW